jgi:DHA1 family bicyclomycin/chloramphenicol resistance-like MFS transporter
LGLLVFGSMSFLIVLVAERGKLFTRPRHDLMRDPKFESMH